MVISDKGEGCIADRPVRRHSAAALSHLLCPSGPCVLHLGLERGIRMLPQHDEIGMYPTAQSISPHRLAWKNTGRHGAGPENLKGLQVTGAQGFPRI